MRQRESLAPADRRLDAVETSARSRSIFALIARPELRAFRNFGLAAVLFAGLFFTWMILSIGGDRLTDGADDVAEFIAVFAASITCFVVSRRAEKAKASAWFLISLGLFSWAVGEAIRIYYDLLRAVPVPFPSVVDIGFLCQVPLLLAGILRFPAMTSGALSRLRVVLDGVIVGGSLLIISWGSVLSATYHADKDGKFAEAISLLYPVTDVMLVTVGVSLAVRARPHYRFALLTVVLGICCLGVSDSAFTYLSQTTTFESGLVIDGGWVVGFLVIGLASLWPMPRSEIAEYENRSLSNWQIALPNLMLGAAGIFLLVKYVLDRHLDAFVIVVGLLLVATVLLRQVVTLFEDARLTRLAADRSMRDPLTGIANRAYFAEHLQRALAARQLGDRAVAVLLCDLDSFKDVNDTLGHFVGDEMLHAVARRLSESIRPTDLVARLGGDEFAILLPALRVPEQASAVAVRIVDSMRTALDFSATRFVPRVSIGIAMQESASTSVEDMLRNADVALYEAKRAGGDSYRVYDGNMGSAHFDYLELQADLGVALEEEQFFLEFEPIIDLSSHRPVGIECLLRWRHPRRGVLKPGAFLDMAERSGAIVAIGDWALSSGLSQYAALREQIALPEDFWLAVNFSPRQLTSDEALSAIAKAVLSHDLAPGQLRLELIESSLVGEESATTELLASLKALGIQLTIDDFGTGYSALSYLGRLPVDALKVDRSLIGGIDTERTQAVILESIVRLAHGLGIEVIVEGVETEPERDTAAALGADRAQGYLFSHSLGFAELTQWLSADLTIAH